jgi:predicted alpha/beta superfamily hydrolase
MVNHIKNKKNMTILKPTKLIITAILFLIFSNSMFSQKLEPKKRITELDHTITSDITGKDYQLYLSFPKSYTTKDTISYPILYVMDGQINFSTIRGMRTLFDLGPLIEDVIIVGIGTSNWKVNRYQDFTPSVDTSEDEERKGTFKSGGAAKFLESIKTEITPFLDKNYKTNADRGITGHSLGGLFTAYCLVNSDGYFTRFGINSPSLWWDNDKVLNQAVAQFTENKIWDLPQTKVFISVGDREGSSMVPTMMKFSKYLEDSNYENIDLKWKIFDEENHISVVPTSLNKTIYTLYGKK